MASVELTQNETFEVPEGTDRAAVTDDVSEDIKNSEKNRRPRRKTGYRRIPRSPADDKENNNNKASRLPKGDRTRTTSVSSVASGRSQRRGGKPRRRTASEGSAVSEAGEAPPLRKLRDTVMEKHQKKGLNLLNSYIKNRMELAKFDNTTGFLERCDALQLVPHKYRLSNSHIKNTKHVIRTLDRFSFNIMFADLKYNRKRRFQVNKLLADKENKMRDMFGDELIEEILKVASEAFERRSNRIRDQQTKIFESLLKEYEITEEEKAEGELRLKRREEQEKSRQERRALERQQRAAEEKADKDEGSDTNEKVSSEAKPDNSGDKLSKEAGQGDDAEVKSTADKQQDKKGKETSVE